MWRVNNVILSPEKITVVIQAERDVNKVTVVFDNGYKLEFIGAEAAELWRRLDEEGDWRSDDSGV